MKKKTIKWHTGRSKKEQLDFTIENAQVKVVEFGWQEVKIIKNGIEYLLEFDTRETPTGSSRNTFVVEFATTESKKLAKKIGFIIDSEFTKELSYAWDKYSNDNFRG